MMVYNLNFVHISFLPKKADAPAVLYLGGQGRNLLVYQRSTAIKADHMATSWAVKE
jgi:hypothetical protein